MLKVWGRKNSANVQKAMWGIGELGLAYERIDIAGAFGKNRDAPYLALNPNGLVPTLEDGDLVMWESNSIVRYLAGLRARVTSSASASETVSASFGRFSRWKRVPSAV